MKIVGISLAVMAVADAVSYPKGADRKSMKGNKVSHKQAVESYQQKLGELRIKSEEKKRSLTPDQALKNLEGRLTSEEKDHLTRLISQEPVKARTLEESKESTLSKLTRAVQNLNTMFLNLDKERAKVEASCVVDLEHMYKVDEQYDYEWNKADKQQSNLAYENIQLHGRVQTEEQNKAAMIDQHKDEQDKAEADYQDQLETVYKPADADVKLYEFIAQSVDENCSDEEKKAAFAQTETEACDSNSMSVANVLEKVFTNPVVLAKVHALPKEQQERFNREVAALGAVSEEESMMTSFLQTSPAPKSEAEKPPPKDISKSKWAAKSECNSQKVTCDDLRTVIGIELVCKRKLRDAEGVSLQELDEKNQRARNKNVAAQKELQGVIDDLKDQIAKNNKDWQEKQTMKDNVDENKAWHVESTVHREHECHDRLEEIYGNSYCSCGALREFMLGLAKKGYKASGHKDPNGKQVPAVVRDCKWDRTFKPDPSCMLNEKEVPCIDGAVTGDKVPHKDPTQIPRRMWRRDELVQPNNHPLSMPCPEPTALSLELPCNMFLCPVDCQMSDWSPPDHLLHTAECSNKCTSRFNGDAFRVQNREIQVNEKYNGAPCEELKKTRACEDNSYCPTDCRMGYRKRECAEACNTGTRTFRDRTRRGAGRLWNRIEMKVPVQLPSTEPKGRECPPAGKYLGRRTFDNSCGWRSARGCRGDEVCVADQMDLVIAYECSAGMQDGYQTSSCRMAVRRILDLLERMYSSFAGVPTMRVALIKYGNGKTQKNEQTGVQEITDVEVPTFQLAPNAWTSDIAKIRDVLDTDDAIDMSYGEADVTSGEGGSSPPPSSFAQDGAAGKKWHWGFANFNEMLEKASDLMGVADGGGESSPRKKALLIFTKGKRIECSNARKLALEIRKKYPIYVSLFSHDYKNKPDKYALVKEMASFPNEIHFSQYDGFGEIFTEGMVERMVPQICKNAISRKFIDHFMARRSSVSPFELRPIHLGRPCPSWMRWRLGGRNLFRRYRRRRSQRGRGLHDCIYAVTKSRRKYKGGLFVRRVFRRRQITACFVNRKLSKMQQVNPDGSANDKTCGKVGRDLRQPCTRRNKRSCIEGWSAMPMSTNNGNVWSTIHFRTQNDGPHPFLGLVTQGSEVEFMYKPQDPTKPAPVIGKAVERKKEESASPSL